MSRDIRIVVEVVDRTTDEVIAKTVRDYPRARSFNEMMEDVKYRITTKIVNKGRSILELLQDQEGGDA